MSDVRARRARWTVGALVAVALALLMVGTGVGTLSQLYAPGRAAAPLALGGGAADNASVRAVAATLREDVGRYAPGLGQIAGQFTDRELYDAFAHDLARFRTLNLGGGISPGVIIAGGIGAGITCAVLAALSAGIGCALLIAAIGAAVLYGLLTGNQAGNLVALASNWANAMYQDYLALQEVETNSTKNTLNALNLTGVALSYEASSAALLQLPNATFSGLLDCAQSSICAQLTTPSMADEFTVASIFNTRSNWFSSEMGPSGTYGSAGAACQLVAAPLNSADHSFANAGGSAIYSPNLVSGWTGGWSSGMTCATSSGSATTYLMNGATYPVTRFTNSSSNIGQVAVETGDFYVLHGAPVVWADSSNTAQPKSAKIIFHGEPNTGLGYYNFTLGVGAGVNFTGPSGAYSVTVAGNPVNTVAPVLGLGMGALPLTSASALGSAESIFLNTTQVDGSGVQHGSTIAGFVPAEVGAGCAAAACVGLGSVPSIMFSAGPQSHLLFWLYTLAHNAENIGQTYWTFLRNLGYTQINQVPANCVIPSPGAILPPNTPPSILANLTVNATLQLYYTYLNGLGYTFNVSNALTVGTFCGKHPHLAIGQLPWSIFPINATGSIYVPCAHGCGGETIGNPASYNITNVSIYLMPSLHPIWPHVNTTWEAPNLNPISGFYALRSGPYAYVATYICAAYCVGNSSNLAGSIYPSGVLTSPVGWAVHLTSCSTAGTWSAAGTQFTPGVNHYTGNCTFGVATINSTGTNLSGCGSINCPGGQGGGGGFGNCGSGVAFIGPFVNTLANSFGSFGQGAGSLGCLVAWAVVIVIALVLLVIVVAVVARVANAARGRPRE